jgi:hypothetical protein
VAELLKQKVNKAKAATPAAASPLAAGEIHGTDGKINLKDIFAAIKAVAASENDDFAMEGAAVGGAGSPLTSRRNAFRKIARERPGALLTSGLEGFKEDLLHIHDNVNEDDPTQPIMVAWYRSIFSPNHRGDDDIDCREVHTLCRVIDLGLEGKLPELLDMLMQRLKAKVFAMSEKSWQTAQHMELLPPIRTASVLTMGEEEFVRRVSCGELRLQDLISRIQNHGQASGSGRGSGGNSR